MRRALKFFGASVLALVLLGAVSIAVTPLWAKDGSGHTLIARLLSRFTGGAVVVHQLTGSLLSAPRFGTVELHDTNGVWAVVHDLRIDWSPFRLVHRDVKFDLFSAAEVDVLRRPAFATSTGKSSWYGFHLDIDKISVGHLDLARPVIGVRASLAADGSLHMAAPSEGKATLALTRLDTAGEYTAKADVSPAHITANLFAKEPANGLIARLANVPDIGPLTVNATIAGPRSNEATKLAVQAGKLLASAQGAVDLQQHTVSLDLTASAPAMSPRPDLSWQSVAVDAHVHGTFTAPNATGTLRVVDLAAAGAKIGRLAADLSGNAGRISLHARAEDVRVPGPNPDLLAAAPVLLTAEIQLDAPTRPVTFSLSHPLLTADGQAATAGAIKGQVAVRIPALAPLAKVATLDLQGHAAFDATFAVSATAKRLNLNGSLAITGGQKQAVALIGQNGQMALDASLAADNTLTLSRLHVGGRAIDLAANGSVGLPSGKLDLTWQGTLGDLHAVVPTVTGRVTAEGRLQGQRTNFALTAKGSGQVGGKGFPPGPVRFDIALGGLPSAPTGHVTAQGVLDKAPLAVAVDLGRSPSGVIHLAIHRADWKSAHAEGTLALAPHATLPEGRIAVRIGRLDDVRPFIGAPIGGSVQATAELAGSSAKVRAKLHDLRLPGTADIANADLDASVTGLMAHPVVDARLTATGVRTAAVSGNAKIDVRGPEDRLTVQLTAKLNQLAGAPAEITSSGVIDAKTKTATLAALHAAWKGAAIRLLTPARVDFGTTKAVEHLRLGVGRAVLTANGRIAPTLDLQVAATNVTPELVRTFVPSLHAKGKLSAEARLRGTVSHPVGIARISAAGLRLTSGPERALPPANVSATVTLDGRAARLDARLGAGSAARLRLAGSVVLAPAGALDLRTTGAVDLALVNPLTAAQGVLVRGRLALNAGVAGTLRAPSITGTMQLTGGDVQDFAQGVHLADMRATIAGAGNTLRVTRFTAKAGKGTVTGSGTVGVLAAGIPLALTVTMRDATPLASNLLTATLDAKLALTGTVAGPLRAAGIIGIRHAEIHVPEHMPQSVAVLPVRIAGQPPAPPPAPGPKIAFDLNLSAPGRIYVRGRGLNVELGGKLHLAGTAKNPQPTGAFRMIRGRSQHRRYDADLQRGRDHVHRPRQCGRRQPDRSGAAFRGDEFERERDRDPDGRRIRLRPQDHALQYPGAAAG